MAFHKLQKTFCRGCESHIFFMGNSNGQLFQSINRDSNKRRLTKELKAAFCKKADPFANFHCADNRFCAGSTQKLRVCITKTVYHRSKMVLRKKRKCSNMKCLELTVLKVVHCFQRTMILSGNLKCFFVKKLSFRSKHSSTLAAVL